MIDMATASTLKLKSQSNYHINLETQGTGDIVLDSNGDITLDSADGNFIASKAGTEFSAANSAYAGMILGYTDLGLDESAVVYNLTDSFAIPLVPLGTQEFNVTFVAPPSGNVEIYLQVGFDVGSSNVGDLYAGLSDNATYNAVADYHEKEIFDAMSRGAHRVIIHSWTLTGLTAGTSYTRWIGFKSTNTSGTPHIQYGSDATGGTSDAIIKAIALPATIAT
jgi:hypothetical protein